MSKFYFRCKANPTAPLLVLDTYWEAAEMKDHPDYERIDESGEVIVDESEGAENRIPLMMVGSK
jgi:hypothetical protein